MYRIAILGCENSHADNFIGYINENLRDKIEVVGVYTEYADAAQRMTEKFGVYVARSFDEFVGKIDGLVITARHGADHLRFARPYLDSRIPMFIDKPITASVDEAVELARLLMAKGIPYSGGSSCVHAKEMAELKEFISGAKTIHSAFLQAPVNLCNPYGDFWFYSQHLVQVMQSLFGFYPTGVRAYREEGKVECIFNYGTFSVHATFASDVYTYFVAAVADKSAISSTLSVDSTVFAKEFLDFYRLLEGGRSEEGLREFISPVFVIDGVIRAMASGKEEQILPIPQDIR